MDLKVKISSVLDEMYKDHDNFNIEVHSKDRVFEGALDEVEINHSTSTIFLKMDNSENGKSYYVHFKIKDILVFEYNEEEGLVNFYLRF